MSEVTFVHNLKLENPSLRKLFRTARPLVVTIAIAAFVYFIFAFVKLIWPMLPPLWSLLCISGLPVSFFGLIALAFLIRRNRFAGAVQTLRLDEQQVELFLVPGRGKALAWQGIQRMTTTLGEEDRVVNITLAGKKVRNNLLIAGFDEMDAIVQAIRLRLPPDVKTETVQTPTIRLGWIHLFLLIGGTLFFQYVVLLDSFRSTLIAVSLVGLLASLRAAASTRNPSRSGFLTPLSITLSISSVLVGAALDTPIFGRNPCNLSQRFLQNSGCVAYVNGADWLTFLPGDTPHRWIADSGINTARIAQRFELPWQGWHTIRYNDWVNGAATSPDGTQLALLTRNELVIETLATGDRVTLPLESYLSMSHLGFSADSQRLYLSDYKDVYLYDTTNPNSALILTNPDERTRFAISSTGTVTATYQFGDTSIATNFTDATFGVPADKSVDRIAVSEANQTVAACMESFSATDNQLQLWQHGNEPVALDTFHCSFLNGIALSADSNWLALITESDEGEQVELWRIDMAQPTRCRMFEAGTLYGESLLFHPSSNMLAIIGSRGTYLLALNTTDCTDRI